MFRAKKRQNKWVLILLWMCYLRLIWFFERHASFFVYNILSHDWPNHHQPLVSASFCSFLPSCPRTWPIALPKNIYILKRHPSKCSPGHLVVFECPFFGWAWLCFGMAWYDGKLRFGGTNTSESANVWQVVAKQRCCNRSICAEFQLDLFAIFNFIW